MKSNQFTAEQIVKLVQLAEQGDKSISQICREAGITNNTFYRWRRKYADLSVAEAERLKELERENARLKRLLAERDLEIDALKEFLTKK